MGSFTLITGLRTKLSAPFKKEEFKKGRPRINVGIPNSLSHPSLRT